MINQYQWLYIGGNADESNATASAHVNIPIKETP